MLVLIFSAANCFRLENLHTSMGNLLNKQHPSRREDYVWENASVGMKEYFSQAERMQLARKDKTIVDTSDEAGRGPGSNALLSVLNDILPAKRGRKKRKGQNSRTTKSARPYRCAKIYPTVQDLRDPEVRRAAVRGSQYQEHNMDMFLASTYLNMKRINNDGGKCIAILY